MYLHAIADADAGQQFQAMTLRADALEIFLYFSQSLHQFFATTAEAL
jgi:hypothetical protein